MARVVVLGAGPMGLAAAYQAVCDGHEVDLVESAPEAGGMAAHFDFGGISLERFYHFVCRDDQPTFDLLEELGLGDKICWVPTSMGFFFHGRLQEWGNPFALLKLKGTSLVTKLRYGLFVSICTHRHTWPSLESLPAKDWILRWCGKQGFENFWRSLLDFKFYQYADRISAAWIWTRIKRVGRSRRSLMQEELGYIEGGSKTLVDALVEAIEQQGGRIHLNSAAQKVMTKDKSVAGVDASGRYFPADFVISTVPVQLIPHLVPDLSSDLKQRYEGVLNIGICCVVFKLNRSVSPHFWINISDRAHEIPGIIEFSNLRRVGLTIIYVPYYMPISNHKFSWTDSELIDDSFRCLQMLNPKLVREDMLEARVARLKHAQPLCDVGFAAKIPPIQTPIRGLQVADTSFYYPEDRGIAESVRLGRRMARAVNATVQVESQDGIPV
jgi:protoporphyrinogen oxidase